MMRTFRTATLTATLTLGLVGLPGCHDDAHDEAAKEAQKALGVGTTKETVKSDVKRDVLYVKEEKVVDRKTGETIGTPVRTETPVTIETKVKQNVDVKAGETQVTSPKK